jgi:nicotinate dehydrogenase subunit A
VAVAGSPSSRTFEVNVNGDRRTVTARPDTPLLYVLRNDWHLRGAKFGCGEGGCGACRILLDGVATASCTLHLGSVGTAAVTTIEGLNDRIAVALRQALVAEQAAQCGYCLPGIAVSATALLLRAPGGRLGQDEIDAALRPNLCRCGSHNRIVRAIRRCAAALHE